jgi:hypothetical protein
VALHGTFELNLDKRLDYDRGSEPAADSGHADTAETESAEG